MPSYIKDTTYYKDAKHPISNNPNSKIKLSTGETDLPSKITKKTITIFVSPVFNIQDVNVYRRVHKKLWSETTTFYSRLTLVVISVLYLHREHLTPNSRTSYVWTDR